MAFQSIFERASCAEAYGALGVEGTFILAYRDLTEIFASRDLGKTALDFGCGTSRSSRLRPGGREPGRMTPSTALGSTRSRWPPSSAMFSNCRELRGPFGPHPMRALG